MIGENYASRCGKGLLRRREQHSGPIEEPIGGSIVTVRTEVGALVMTKSSRDPGFRGFVGETSWPPGGRVTSLTTCVSGERFEEHCRNLCRVRQFSHP